jgi:nucleotide-binding universal stress UspA family protein
MFRAILCPTDFSNGASRALDVAMAWAEAHGASIELLHVIAPPISAIPLDSALLDKLHASVRLQAARDLEGLVIRARSRGVRATGHVVVGFPHREIAARAEASKCDLVVLGTTGRGPISRAIVGSVADRVTRSIATPILLVPVEGSLRRIPPNVIVAPTDLSAPSQEAVVRALALAVESGATVEVVHAYEVPLVASNETALIRAHARTLADDVRNAHALTTRNDLHVHIVQDAPARAVCEIVASKHADLVVLATSGRSRTAAFFLGSVTDRLLRTCHVPMMVLHPSQ